MRLKILSMVVMTSLMLCQFLYAAEFKKPSNSELKKKLTEEQFEVTQKNGTEPPFKNAYWDNHEDGIYVDIVSGEPLFSSLDKYDSKTGWPSFTRPLVKENLIEKEDRSLFSLRTEVRSKLADSHLGHVFDDGPAPTGKRYCMNSAALRFIPKAELQAKGYGEYLKLFAKTSETTTAKAIFAGGCFWCMEAPFDQVPGVVSVTVGYTGGTTTNPTYAQVSAGQTSHLEAVEIIYQKDKVSFRDLVNIFWRQVDPFQGDGQFCDHGPQYQAAIFFDSDQEKAIAEETKTEIAKKFNRPVATLVRPISTFYPAEDYHQHYYKKNPIRYKYYRTGCGRDAQLNRIWK